MKRSESNCCIPKDWRAFLGLQVVVPAIVLLVGCLFPLLSRAGEGDLALVWIAPPCAIIGIALLFVAKWPLYRDGKFFTFGPRTLPSRYRGLYYIAYAFIGAAVLLMLSLLAMSVVIAPR